LSFRWDSLVVFSTELLCLLVNAFIALPCSRSTKAPPVFRILHLSDLHIKEADRWRSDALLDAARTILLREAEADNIDVLAFTGDIAHGGKQAEYDIAYQWIDSVFLSPDGLNLDEHRLLFVPGNHDVDRSAIRPIAKAVEESLARATCQEDVAKYYEDSIGDMLLRHANYSTFCRTVRGDASLSLPAWTQRFEYGQYSIAFEGFCTSWLSSGEDQKRLLISQPQITDRINCRAPSDISIAMMHHPLSDLMDFDARNTEQHLRTHHHLLLRGHLHNADTVVHRSSAGSYLEVASGALQERLDSPNRFSLIDIAEDLVS
jgi:UDP-2,3-diacylglucosamine pyrophosphatase LpxH